MIRRASSCLFGAIAVCTAGDPALAEDDPPTELAADISIPKSAPGSVATFPIESVLDALRQARSFAFIFDSRLIAGKKIRAVDQSGSAERDLADALDAVQLRLHKLAPKTYAITASSIVATQVEAVLDTAGPAEPVIDTILVTGSSSNALAATGSKRIFNIDADELAYLGVTSPAEAIYALPQSLASFTPSNTALFASAAGVSLADLRGMEPKRTLVLVNGRRRTLTTGGNGDIGGVDLSSLAEPFLERIEVQNLPSGARFGASAVAGAINFVTKSNFEGLEVGAQFGISERSDSETASLYAIGGRTFENLGNLTIGVNATRSEGLIGGDRPFSAEPWGFGLNGVRNFSPAAEFLPGFGGSNTSDRGGFGGVVRSDGSFSPFPGVSAYVPAADGSIAPFIAARDQLYNWAFLQSLTIPNDRIIGQLSFNSDVANNVKFFAELHGGVAANDASLSPLPATRGRGLDPVTGDAAVIPLDNPFLPQSIRDLVEANFGADAEAVVFDHRFAELGPRRQKIDRRHLDFSAGVEFSDKHERKLSLTYRYGSNRTLSRELDRVDLSKLGIALDPAACSATPNCSLVDFFTTPEISKSALDFIVIPEVPRKLTVEEHETTAGASAKFDIDQDREIRVGAIVEFRHVKFADRDLTPDGARPAAYFRGLDATSVVDTLDAVFELDSAIIRAGEFPGEIDGSTAIRITNSSEFDAAFNFEAGVDWRPAPGVEFFARRHIGERAPNVIEMFALGPTFEIAFSDPCGLPPHEQSQTVQANCASGGRLGVRPGFQQTAPLATSTFYGGATLEPERIRSAAYGLTISPTDIFATLPGRMEMTATWLDFEIRNAVTSAADVLTDCYSSVGLSAETCGVNPRTGEPTIMRDPVTQQIVSFDEILQNGAGLDWRGLDLELRYAVDLDGLAFADSAWLSVLHTFIERARTMDSSGEWMLLDGLIDFPHHRTLASAGINSGRWSFVAYSSRRGRARTVRSSRAETRIPAALYLDLTGRYELTDRAHVQFGVQNLTDREPAITAFNEIGNFAPEFYDPIGRRYLLSFRMNF